MANQCDNHHLLATSPLCCLKHKRRGLSHHPHPLSLPPAPSVAGNMSRGVLSACHSPLSLKTQAEGSPLPATPPSVARKAPVPADESPMKLAVYFRNWRMFHEHMNNIAC